MMMNNLLAITLVLTSLLASLVWSPSPSSSLPHQQVIVKNGHHAVVVEYDKDAAAGTTKVSISPYDVVRSEAVASGDKKPAEETSSGSRNLVCDAYGKCKEKLANAVGKTKEMVAEKTQEIEEDAKEAIGKIPQDVGEAKEKLSEVSIKVPGHTIGTVAEGVSKVKEVAGDVMGTVKDGVSKVKNFDMVDSPKRIREDISRNVSGKVQETAEHVKEQAKETVHKIGENSLNDIFFKLKEVTYDVIRYIFYRDKMGSVVGLIHMLGFSTAYGMCVWVTFVSSYILGRCLPGEMFGMVQSKIYPVYFKAMCYCVCAALLGHLVGQRSHEVLGSKMGMLQISLSLVSALLMILTNMIFLEPKAAKALNKRTKLEKEEGRGVAVAAAAKNRPMVEDGDVTRVRSGPNGKGVRVPKDGMVGGSGVGASTVVRSVVVERQDVLRLNERLKRLNAYSSALNLFTLVVLTWHMAYMVQRLQATR